MIGAAKPYSLISVTLSRSRASFTNRLPNEAVSHCGVAGRALAASARRGGYVPLVVDMVRRRGHARRWARLMRRLENGLARENDRRCDSMRRCPPHQAEPAARHRLRNRLRAPRIARESGAALASSAAAPRRFGWSRTRRLLHPFAGIARCRIRRFHARARRTPRAGSRSARAARAEVMLALRRSARRQILYYQRHVSGEPVSALFLADGQRACVLGSARNGCLPRRVNFIVMAVQ